MSNEEDRKEIRNSNRSKVVGKKSFRGEKTFISKFPGKTGEDVNEGDATVSEAPAKKGKKAKAEE